MGFFGGLRGPELLVILLIVLIIFGAGKLPEVGSALGRAIREFRKTQSDETEAPSVQPDEDKEKTTTTSSS